MMRKKIKFLVTDYDDCAISNSSLLRDDLLSSALIEHVNQSEYSGFYGCTIRSYLSLSAKAKMQTMMGNSYNSDDNNHTYKITENFSRATNLPCMAVSTPDDDLYDACGVAYERVIKPHEETGQEPSSELLLKIQSNSINFSSKNSQLIQIAQHARKQYPDALITLDYVDDQKYLCWQATMVEANENWPENIKLNIFHHDANRKNAILTPYHPNKNDEKKEIPLSFFGVRNNSQANLKATRNYCQFGLWKPVTTAVAVGVGLVLYSLTNT